MIGVFLWVGTPHRVIHALIATGKGGCSVIANDTARPGMKSKCSACVRISCDPAARDCIRSHLAPQM